MKNTLLLKILIILQVFSLPCLPTYAMTLKECTESSLENSKLLEAYENKVSSSIASYRKDQSELWPKLSANAESDYLRFGKESDLPRRSGNEGRVSVSATLDLQKILSHYPELSHLDIEKNRLIRKISESEIQKSVTQDYYKLGILLKKKRDYADANAYFNELIKDIEKLGSQGVDVKLDLGRARVQLNSLQISAGGVSSEIEHTLLSLGSMMNTRLKESDFSSMDEPDINSMKVNRAVSGEDSQNLVQSRADEMDLRISKAAYNRSGVYYAPSLQAGLNHNIDTVDPNAEAYRVFLALSFDIFDFGQKAKEREELKYAYEAQKNLFENNQRKLKTQIEQLTADVGNLQAIYKNASDNLNTASQSIETAKIYYRQGKIKEADLLNTFSDYLAAKNQAYDVLSDYLSKKVELDFLLRGMGK